MESETKLSNKESAVFNAAQKARMERNRLKALTLRESKVIPHPTAKMRCHLTAKISHGFRSMATVQKQTSVASLIQNMKRCFCRVAAVSVGAWHDTGGGFLLEAASCPSAPAPRAALPAPPPPMPPALQPRCLECGERFAISHLLETFQYSVCDRCRDDEDKHSLITRTEAKSEYLLKDCDLDSRPPPLRHVERANPHNARWGSMKLYLHVQVEERALLVWGSEEALLQERARREGRREETRAKRYGREMRALRMRVRSSLYTGKGAGGAGTGAACTHSYRETRLDEDTYRGECALCGHTTTYEKM